MVSALPGRAVKPTPRDGGQQDVGDGELLAHPVPEAARLEAKGWFFPIELLFFFFFFFFKGAQVGGRTWDLFDFRLFSLTSSALDHSATAPPT